jgi:hypothetical protein
LVLAVVLALPLLGVSPSSAAGAGGVYNVVKCHPWHLEADEIQEAGGHPSYGQINKCSGTFQDRYIGIYNLGAAGNSAYKQFMYTAPAWTHIETVCLDYNLRRDGHHLAQLLAYPGFQLLANGGDGPAGWTHGCFDLRHSQLIIRLACAQAGGCPEGLNAHAYVRNIVIALADDANPAITAFGGDMTDSGWLRGTKTLIADAADVGSGVFHLVGYVNGHEIGRVTNLCSTGGLPWNFAVQLAPCGANVGSLAFERDTSSPPFANGENTVTAYVADYGGNVATESTTVRIDNERPSAAFQNELDSSDPELIRVRVSDEHSGVHSAQLYYRAVGAENWLPLDTRLSANTAQARVDSSAAPPGTYEFRAIANDVAGNAFETMLCADGSPMRLEFPLRTRVELRTSLGEGGATGQTVPYGTESKVHGRLLDPAGEPLAGQPVVVVDRFDNGALYPRAERPAVTDEQGRFSVPEPAGPTRSIEATYGGSTKYLPAHDEVGKFAVKGAASFRVSDRKIPEGSPVTFKGRVKHRGARIPAGGKLVEIQYRLKTGRQRTLKQPFRTKPNGSYQLNYRFSKALTSDALFRFRVKVRNEGNWPFKGSSSKWRKVIVRAH